MADGLATAVIGYTGCTDYVYPQGCISPAENTTLLLKFENLPAPSKRRLVTLSPSEVEVSVAWIEDSGVAPLAAPRVEHRKAVRNGSSVALSLDVTPGCALFVAVGAGAAHAVERFATAPNPGAAAV
jgi:hypothetical protein